MISIDPGWRRPLRLGVLAVYGPFFVMTLGMLVFVPCLHCKEAAATVFLAGPGYAAARLALARVMRGDAHGVSWIVGAAFGVAAVAFVAWAVKRGASGARFATTAAAVLFSFVALGTASMIRQ